MNEWDSALHIGGVITYYVWLFSLGHMINFYQYLAIINNLANYIEKIAG